MPAADQSRSHQPWAVLILLMSVGILNMLDRLLPAILAQPIKDDLVLSDMTLGIINGIGFLLIYAFASVPIARLSDSGRYGAVVGVCLGFWSAMTALGGMVAHGWQLALARMGVAVGEAGSTPAVHAFITRNFRPDSRTTAIALYTVATPLGTMSGFMSGGFFGELLGWRHTFLLMGIVGMILAPIIYLALRPYQAKATPKPAKGEAKAASGPGISVLLKKPALVGVVVAAAVVAFGGYCGTAFTPAFLMRSHGMTVGEAGVQFGLLSGIVGVISLLTTGWIADRMSRRDPRWICWVAALMIAICLPFSVASFLVPDRVTAMGCLALNYTVTLAYLAPSFAAVHRLAPVELRARASAILMFFNSMIGGLGPVVVGALSDHLTPALGDAALGRAMLLIVPASYGLAALIYVASTITFKRDMVEEDRT